MGTYFYLPVVFWSSVLGMLYYRVFFGGPKDGPFDLFCVLGLPIFVAYYVIRFRPIVAEVRGAFVWSKLGGIGMGVWMSLPALVLFAFYGVMVWARLNSNF